MNEPAATALIAAILKLAHDDYTAGEFESEHKTESERVRDRNAQDARRFLHGQWCRDLCDNINIDYEKFVEVTIQKSRMASPVFKYIESEVRDYHKTLQEIETLKRDLIEGSQPVENKGGKSLTVGNPTESKAIKIISDKKLARMESVARAIKTVYDASDDKRKTLVRLKYWQHIYTDDGIANHLGIGLKTFYRWKRDFILRVALKLGYL